MPRAAAQGASDVEGSITPSLYDVEKGEINIYITTNKIYIEYLYRSNCKWNTDRPVLCIVPHNKILILDFTLR
jgi:hypothetical protein